MDWSAGGHGGWLVARLVVQHFGLRDVRSGPSEPVTDTFTQIEPKSVLGRKLPSATRQIIAIDPLGTWQRDHDSISRPGTSTMYRSSKTSW